MGFSDMADRIVWPASVTWPEVTTLDLSAHIRRQYTIRHTITFESLDVVHCRTSCRLRPLYLLWLPSSLKVIRSKWSSRKQKGRKCVLPQCKTCVSNHCDSIKHRPRAMKFACSMKFFSYCWLNGVTAIFVTWAEVTTRTKCMHSRRRGRPVIAVSGEIESQCYFYSWLYGYKHWAGAQAVSESYHTRVLMHGTWQQAIYLAITVAFTDNHHPSECAVANEHGTWQQAIYLAITVAFTDNHHPSECTIIPVNVLLLMSACFLFGFSLSLSLCFLHYFSCTLVRFT